MDVRRYCHWIIYKIYKIETDELGFEYKNRNYVPLQFPYDHALLNGWAAHHEKQFNKQITWHQWPGV